MKEERDIEVKPQASLNDQSSTEGTNTTDDSAGNKRQMTVSAHQRKAEIMKAI